MPHLKNLIKNTEARFISYKKMLEERPQDESYKDMLREGSNYEKILLKQLIKEKEYQNENLNPPYFYK